MLRAKTMAFPFVTLAVSSALLLTVTQRLIDRGVGYEMGAKAPSLSADTSAIAKLDCSGFAEYALWKAAEPGTTATDIQEGSVVEHDWIAAQGFKPSTVAAAALDDGVLRIAFLAPQGGEPGHVMLVLGGKTLESHGGKGVDRRVWDPEQHPFMARCAVYVLTPPPQAS